jgi:hypothetical protein
MKKKFECLPIVFHKYLTPILITDKLSLVEAFEGAVPAVPFQHFPKDLRETLCFPNNFLPFVNCDYISVPLRTQKSLPFLGAFVKLRNATISFVISVRPSVRITRRGMLASQVE